MLYDASGTLIYDVIEPDPMGVVLQNNGAYFIGTVIDLEAKTVQSLVCDRSTGDEIYFKESMSKEEYMRQNKLGCNELKQKYKKA